MRRFVARVALIMVLIALLPLAPGTERAHFAMAAGPICTVNPSGGATYTTIQAAVADTGCTTIHLAAGTYAGAITIGRSLTLSGAGASTTFIDGAGADRVLHIDSGPVTIAGVTIRNGHPHPGDGGGIENYGTLTLNSSAVISNTAEGDAIGSFGWGGGIFSAGPLTVNDTTIANNTTNGSI